MTRSYIIRCFLGILLMMTVLVSAAQPILGYQLITTGLTNPVDVVDAGDNRLYIVQQGGLIRLWNGSTLSTFLNISSLITSPTASEQGLLSIAFHPSYSTNRYFFIWYTGTNGLLTLARYQRDAINPDIADPASGQVLLTQPKPGTTPFTNHNGAKLNFGPDGYLYIGTGDGGSAGDPFNNAQNGNSLLGKMLRIDVNGFSTADPFYTIPPTNPFLSPGDGILDEIYAIGLRNPWRWSFDRNTGDMWIGDVGQGTWEEVNFRPAASTAGVNYGWDCYEGSVQYSGSSCTPPGAIMPIFAYGHNSTTGGFSITGGYVYRGTEFPALQGYYITADYVSGNVWTIRPNGSGGWITNIQSGLPSNISSFGESVNGDIYAVKRNTGALYKVFLSSVVPVTLTRFEGKSLQGINALEWTSVEEGTNLTYHIEYSLNGRDFLMLDKVNGGLQAGETYTYDHQHKLTGYVYYRLRMEESGERTRYSHIIRLQTKNSGEFSVSPNMIDGGRITVRFTGNKEALRLCNTQGVILWQKNIQGLQGPLTVKLPDVGAGMYVLSIMGRDGILHERIFIR